MYSFFSETRHELEYGFSLPTEQGVSDQIGELYILSEHSAYRMIKDDLTLDGTPTLNLASFVTTYMVCCYNQLPHGIRTDEPN